jgi:parvulin-like peptidyl-prolyl isomerase
MAFSPVLRSALHSSGNFFRLTVLLSTGMALLAGCHPAATAPKVANLDPQNPDFVVAEIGNWKVLRSDLNKEVNNYLKQRQWTAQQVGAKMPLLETMALKNYVLKKLLLDKAAALQLKDADVDKEVNDALDSIKSRVPPGQDFDQALKAAGLTIDDVKKPIREKILIVKVMEADAVKNAEPTEQEIDDIYLKNKASFTIPDKVRASRVLVHVDEHTSPADRAAKKKVIDKARARVAHGEDFAKVATEVSEDTTTAPRGGDLGFFQRGEVESPQFDDVAFATKEGVISPVFETPAGYEFLKVTAMQPAGPLPVADARNFISSKLKEMKTAQQEQDFAKKTLADSGVVYHITLIDPPAQTAGPDGSPAPGSGATDSAPPAQAPDASAPPEAATAPEPPTTATNRAPAK